MAKRKWRRDKLVATIRRATLQMERLNPVFIFARLVGMQQIFDAQTFCFKAIRPIFQEVQGMHTRERQSTSRPTNKEIVYRKQHRAMQEKGII